jgi:hypothetical protein
MWLLAVLLLTVSFLPVKVKANQSDLQHIDNTTIINICK